MYDGPRNWKWMLPAAGSALSGLVGWNLSTNPIWLWQDLLSQFLLIVSAICALAAVSNYIHYYRYVNAENLQTRQNALSTTPTVLLAQALRGMHPDAINALNLRAAEAWKIRAGTSAPEYYLDGPALPVPMELVAYVLAHSNDYSIMPERVFTDGAKTFDAYKRHSDRELYRSLIMWWFSQTKCTTPLGNNSALWIPPWNPSTERAALGLETSTPAIVE